MKNNIYPKKDKTYFEKQVKNKEYFKEIINHLKNCKKKINLIDVGCASGDFLKILSKNKKLSLTGIDFSEELLSLAKIKVPEAKFLKKDLKKKINLNKKYDICTCLGTLSAFDNKFTIIDKLINITKKGGELIFFDPINEYDVNVLVRYQNNTQKNSKWLSAYNTFSKKYWITTLKKNKKIKKIVFKKFNLPIIIKKNKENPMRSWTFKLNNKNQIMVGTGQLLNLYFIKIKLKS